MRDVKPIIGYVHTGIEKTAEDKSYWKVIPVIERMDYLAYYFNAMAYCGASRRSSTSTCRRAPSTCASSTSSSTGSPRTCCGWPPVGSTSARSRCSGTAGATATAVLDLFEMSSGQRMHTRYIQVGGVAEDIPVGWADKVRRFCADYPSRADQFENLIDSNQIVLQRLRGTGWSTSRRCSTSASRARCCAQRQPVGPAQGRAVPSYDHFDFKIRSARSATTTTATACGWPRCASR